MLKIYEHLISGYDVFHAVRNFCNIHDPLINDLRLNKLDLPSSETLMQKQGTKKIETLEPLLF